MTTEQQPKVLKDKMFRLPTEEEPKLEKLIQLAYAMTHIKKPSLQRFMVFAIHCAADYLKTKYLESKTP